MMPTALALLLLVTAPASRPYFAPLLATPNAACTDGLTNQPRAVLDQSASDWYSRHLRAADEPSLYRRSLTVDGGRRRAFRFTWLRSFHHPVTIRIEVQSRASARLVAKELSGRGGYEPGRRRRTLERALFAVELRRFEAALERTHAADLPPACELQMDGAEWIFEMIDAAGYHFARRDSPEDGPAYDMGLLLIRLTGWSVGDVY